jgi:hypothetical protein
MLFVTEWPLSTVIVQPVTETLAAERFSMRYITSPSVRPTNISDEFARLSKRKIDACNPWTRPLERELKLSKLCPFIETISAKHLLV